MIYTAARIWLLFIFCFISGGLMLSSGESLITTALVLAGFVSILGGANGVILRSLVRRGKTFAFVSLSDLAHLERREWVQVLLLLAIGVGLLVGGFATIRGGA